MRKRALLCAAAALLLAAGFGVATARSAQPPSATTGDPDAVTATSATLTGTVNPEGQSTTYQFQYGTTTSYGAETLPTAAGGGSSSVPAAAAIAGLTPGTAYHYRLVAASAAGATDGSDHTFTTASVASGRSPTVATGSATHVTTTSATLTASVNPQGEPTKFTFQYGPTRAYGFQTTPADAGGGTSAVNVATAIANLTANTTYHYRVIASDASGTSNGSDRSFKTKKLPPGPNGVTVRALPNPIVFTGSTTVFGSLIGANHGGRTVTLQAGPSAGGPFTPVATTKTASSGAYAFLGVAPGQDEYYRAAGGGGVSRPIRVLVSFRVEFLAVTPRHPLRGSVVTFSGTVGPGNRPVVALLQRVGRRGRFGTIARVVVPVNSTAPGHFSFHIRLTRGGVFRLGARGDASNTRGFSVAARVRVRVR